MRIRLLCFAMFLCTLSLFTKAQSAQKDSLITIGKRYQLYSKMLSETREYWVHLPQDFDKNKTYPVVYLLDGDINFELLVGMQQYLTRGRQPMLPSMVIIGVLNTNRTRDLTVSHANDVPGSNQKGGSYVQSGGANVFLKFLKTELKYTIEQDLGVKTLNNTMVGHSFGGMTALGDYLLGDDFFSAYIAMDPSLWWDNQILVKWAKDAQPLKNKKIYISASGSGLGQSSSSFDELTARLTNKRNVQVKRIANETHGSVSLISMYEGLKFIFGNAPDH